MDAKKPGSGDDPRWRSIALAPAAVCVLLSIAEPPENRGELVGLF